MKPPLVLSLLAILVAAVLLATLGRRHPMAASSPAPPFALSSHPHAAGNTFTQKSGDATARNMDAPSHVLPSKASLSAEAYTPSITLAAGPSEPIRGDQHSLATSSQLSPAHASEGAFPPVIDDSIAASPTSPQAADSPDKKMSEQIVPASLPLFAQVSSLKPSPVANTPAASPALEAGSSPATPAPAVAIPGAADNNVAQQAIQENLQTTFVQDLGGPNQDPNDAAYFQRWETARSNSDNVYRQQYGWAAANAGGIFSAQQQEANRKKAAAPAP